MSKLPGKDTIEALGGYRAVSKACGWPLTTVQSWWRDDKAIPVWRHDKILKLARRKGIELLSRPPDMDLTSIINLVLAFAMVPYALAAAMRDRPWIASAGVLAGALNLSQFILHQQP